MIIYIYKVLELLYPEEDILNQKPIKKQVKPELLASVVCGEPRKVAIYNEEGEKTGEEEVFNIQDYYPSFDSEAMVASDKKFIEPVLVEGKIVEGYVKPVVKEVVVEPIEPTDDEKLESLKQQIIDVNFQLYKFEIAGFDNDELRKKLSSLIESHLKLSKTIAFSKKEEEVNENV